MNFRQHKRNIVSKMYYIIAQANWLRFINGLRDTPEEIKRRHAAFDEIWGDLFTPLDVGGLVVADNLSSMIEETKREFVCQKVKDGSVVYSFDTLDAAKNLVIKHARQKKAKLQVLDTLTGELVPISEEELSA